MPDDNVSVSRSLLFKLISYNEDEEREDFFQQLEDGNVSYDLTEDEIEFLLEQEHMPIKDEKRFNELFDKAINSYEAKNHVYHDIEMLRRQAMGKT